MNQGRAAIDKDADSSQWESFNPHDLNHDSNSFKSKAFISKRYFDSKLYKMYLNLHVCL